MNGGFSRSQVGSSHSQFAAAWATCCSFSFAVWVLALFFVGLPAGSVAVGACGGGGLMGSRVRFEALGLGLAHPMYRFFLVFSAWPVGVFWALSH